MANFAQPKSMTKIQPSLRPWMVKDAAQLYVAVTEHAGAIHEGRQRKRLILHGLDHDAAMYAIYRN